jgi:hypothetical protein
LKAEDAVADYSTLDEKERKVLDDWHAFFSWVVFCFVVILLFQRPIQEAIQYCWKGHRWSYHRQLNESGIIIEPIHLIIDKETKKAKEASLLLCSTHPTIVMLFRIFI